MNFHPLAAIFPLLEGPAFDDFAADIAQHGLREPIIMHEDKILDGRNRYRACVAAAIEARFETFAGVRRDESAGANGASSGAFHGAKRLMEGCRRASR